MSDVLVSVFARTDVGMMRSGNEDSFLVADLTTGNVGLGSDVNTYKLGDRGSLMVVSDGMGGAAAGEIASEMAVSIISDSLNAQQHDCEMADRLRLATETANELIWNHAREHPELTGMGATVTAVVAQGTQAYIAQVGDSRAYLIRGSRIKQLTKDQSLAQMLVDAGAISPDQMEAVPQNVIMQALGTQAIVKVAMSAIQLFRNDCLLICSDGLSNKIPAREMQEIVEHSDALTEACRAMIETANERGGEDNITVIVARFDGEDLHSASESNSITGSFRALSQYYLDDGLATQRSDEAPTLRDINKETTTVIPVVQGEPETTILSAESGEVTERLDGELRDLNARQRDQRSFMLILVVCLVSLLLLAATGYFFYLRYLKAQPSPDQIEPQTNTSSESHQTN
jgi:PPM family protein phosphatase